MSVLQITIITIFGFITRVTAAEQNGLPGSDLPDWYFEYRPGVEGGRFLFYVGPNPLLLDPKLREHTPKTYSEAIRIFGPAFIHSLSGLGAREWNFSDGKRFRHGGGGLEAPFEAKLEDSTFTLITVTVGKEGQQAKVPAEVNPNPSSSWNPELMEGRFCSYRGEKPVMLNASLRNEWPKTYLEAIQIFGPAFHRTSESECWEWDFTDRKALRSKGKPTKLDQPFDAELIESGERTDTAPAR